MSNSILFSSLLFNSNQESSLSCLHTSVEKWFLVLVLCVRVYTYTRTHNEIFISSYAELVLHIFWTSGQWTQVVMQKGYVAHQNKTMNPRLILFSYKYRKTMNKRCSWDWSGSSAVASIYPKKPTPRSSEK